MTYVTEQTSAELRAHMRRLQAIPGWHNPLDDRLFKEIQALDAEIAALRSTLPPLAITAEEAGREGEAKQVGWIDEFGNVFPMAAYSGKPFWHDDHKAKWRPVFDTHKPQDAHDAARYRWLRERNSILEGDSGIFTAIRTTFPSGEFAGNDLIANEEMDAAIDAAMLPSAPAQSGGQGNG